MRGILIVNTGSPKTKNREDVKFFIGAMLSDPLVMSTVPDWFRTTLATKIIAPLRASSSASHYSLIWNDEQTESPLLYNTTQLAKKIEEATNIPVEVAMRYGLPSIPEALERLEARCDTLREVVVLPLFPQYAQSSYKTVADAVTNHFQSKPHSFKLRIIEPYYSDPNYIQALAESLRPHIEKGYDRLVFSFHSLPLSHVDTGWKLGKDFDYVYQIKETIRLVTKELGIDPQKNRIVYSSAMGGKWLKPDLNETMKQLPVDGSKRVIAITPGFPADNLETLYDIGIVARDNFMKAGGEEFTFVPSLNFEDYWVKGVIKLIVES